MNKADEPMETRPAGWAVYVPDAQGHFVEVPPHWRYPSEEHARRVAYQRLLEDRIPVQVRYFAEEDRLDGDDKSELVEECDPGNAELMETIEARYTDQPSASIIASIGESGAKGTLRDASEGDEIVP